MADGERKVKPRRRSKLPSLGMSCTSTDCDNDLHCFRHARRKANPRGPCRNCGADLVDWPRVTSRDVEDVANTFAALQHERIRHHYWHTEIDQKALNYARRKGRIELAAAIKHRLSKVVAGAEPYRDGTQTPFSDNIIYYAQHATASCCRKCIEEWHGIERGREMSEEEITYLTTLAMGYIEMRLPDLPSLGQKVSAIRRQRGGSDDDQPIGH